MPIKHTFVSAKTNGADATQVQPSNWNDDHDTSGLSTTDIVDYPKPWVPGMLYLPTLPGITSTPATSTVANALRGINLRFDQPGVFSPWINVTTAVAGGSIAVALYQQSAAGLPTTKVVDLGVLSFASTGQVVGTAASIPAGAYVLVASFSSAGAASAVLVPEGAAPQGAAGITPAQVIGNKTIVTRLDATVTYTGTMPSDLSAQTWTVATIASSYLVLLKAA